jgi:vitamin B12 transporter
MRRKLSSITASVLSLTASVLIALAVAQSAHGRPRQQESAAAVAGRVTDPRGAGVAGASVRLYARDRSGQHAPLSTVTDASGGYRFERLAPGEYAVEAEAEGFARAAARVVRVASGGAAVAGVDVRLEVAGVSEQVVVTASDAPQTVDEVSKAVTVVGGREMEERDESHLAEALRTVPGLRVQQLGGPGSFTTIKTRGLRNQDTALLIDGLRFRDVTAERGDASGFIGDFLTTGAGRVEVLRGSGSSLYGTNAVGGVVNVVTDEGGGPFRGSLLAEGGGLGSFRGRAQVAGGAGEADRVAYSAAVSHLNVSRGVDGDDAARTTNAQGRAVLRLSPTSTLSARVYAADSFVQLNDDPQAVGAFAGGIVEARPLAPDELRRFESGVPLGQLSLGAANFVPAANDPDSSRAARFFAGAVTFAHRPFESFGYSLTYQGLATRNSFREGPSGTSPFEPAANTLNDFVGRVHTVNARADLRLGRHNFVTAGYEFESESFNNRALAASPSDNLSVEVTQRSHAFFIQDQLRLLDDRLQLSAAFRAQLFSLGRPRITPSAGAPYAGLTFDAPPNAYTGDGSAAYLFRSTGTKLRAHVGNGYRAPSLYERYGTSLFFGFFSALGDPRLRPDRSVAFDAGLDQTLADGRARLSATYFYTRLQEVIDFGPTPNDPFGRFFGYVNAGGGLARGAELSAELAPTRTLNLTASYTYTNSDQRLPRQGVLRTLGIPEHQFSLVATQRVGPRFYLNFDLVASSDYLVGSIFQNDFPFANPVYRFDGPFKADLGASYTWPLAESRSVRLFGKVENLFDCDYYENGFRTPGVNARAGAAFSF